MVWLSPLLLAMVAGPAVQVEPAGRLTRAEAEATLLAFGRTVDARHAHAAFLGVSVESAARLSLESLEGETVALEHLLRRMETLLAPLGDGHAGLRFEDAAARDRWRTSLGSATAAHLPFLVEMLGEQPGDPVIAIAADRTGFLDEHRPRLTAIDGVPIEDWIRVASGVVPEGSPAFRRSRALRELRSLWRWRDALGLPGVREIRVTLSALDGRNPRELRVAARSGRLERGRLPDSESGLLPGDIGYLRLASMNLSGSELEALHGWMERFRSARALIIDVRGNGGGRRNALHLLGGYLVAPDAEPFVYTAARPLRVEGGEELSANMRRRLADRYLFVAEDTHWSFAERRAIADYLERVRDAQPSEDRFGPWHFACLRPGGDPRTYHFDRPVVVLMDADCFSATDVFLNALGALPQVTRMGQPSAGSSGAPLSWPTELPGVQVRLASILSYRVDGARFDDGQSEYPERRIDPEPSDWIGRTDRVLEAAIAYLTESVGTGAGGGPSEEAQPRR